MTGNAVDVLAQQHQEIANLFYRVSDPEADRPAILQDLLKSLAAHVSVERTVLYPVVKNRHTGDDGGEMGATGEVMARDLLHDYDEIERLLVLIERRKANSPDMVDLVSELKRVTEGHIRRTDEELFGFLENTLSPHEMAELGSEAAAAESTIMSHPHPHLLSLGPLSRFTTRLAATFDRLRDRTVNNRHPG